MFTSLQFISSNIDSPLGRTPAALVAKKSIADTDWAISLQVFQW